MITTFAAVMWNLLTQLSRLVGLPLRCPPPPWRCSTSPQFDSLIYGGQPFKLAFHHRLLLCCLLPRNQAGMQDCGHSKVNWELIKRVVGNFKIRIKKCFLNADSTSFSHSWEGVNSRSCRLGEALILGTTLAPSNHASSCEVVTPQSPTAVLNFVCMYVLEYMHSGTN